MGAVAVGGFVVGGCRRLKRAGDGRWVVARRFAGKEVGGRYGGGQRQAEEVEQKTFSGRYAVYIYIYMVRWQDQAKAKINQGASAILYIR
jgi:hypothetical protein